MNKLIFHKKETREKLRSSFIISSLAQCIEELALNSLDANATNINIYLDTRKMSLEVYDNGDGISKKNLELVGRKSKSFCVINVPVLRLINIFISS